MIGKTCINYKNRDDRKIDLSLSKQVMSYWCQYEAITIFRKQDSMPSFELRIDFDESLTELLANFSAQFLSASVQKTTEESGMAILHVYLSMC